MPSALLLDTHYWVWLAFGRLDQIGASAKTLIEDHAKRGNLLVSVISVWELGMLEQKKRIRLDIGVDAWVRNALAIPGLSLVSISSEIALAASRLPGDFHGDPADRMIVATAREHQAQLLTKDRAILEYGKQSYVKTTL